ncbi:hypothetical protein [Clostridioides difficile]|uniref:hypothetical protein n=1 Tax=Clostridioides difficile TaxID=1496 RepID=UPI00038CBEDF|nr:hypothetical protein [Clostridioides difficile]EIS9584708.1 hypothetical protein [Clostridioides difficile]EQG17518.1 lysR substrate binding domain protein [Clostridioides difficile DA00065]EQK21017.1 lysR substrate binding domain protein [Clostridioides difficile P71]EQK30100.1 lysR substrate binding domain protein [Clostridioides difficile P74]MBH7393154.1 hypothetical protein [Clostridioides difficile]
MLELEILKLPRLILQHIPYHTVAKKLEVSVYRNIEIVLRYKKNISLAVKQFINYIKYR